MRWPWSRPDTTGAAERAVEDAKKHLEEAQQIRPEVREVAGRLRELRETNGFLSTIQSLFESTAPWVDR